MNKKLTYIEDVILPKVGKISTAVLIAIYSLKFAYEVSDSKIVDGYAIVERGNSRIIMPFNANRSMIDENMDGTLDRKFYSIIGGPWGSGINPIRIEEKITETDQREYQNLLSKLK